MIETVAYPTRLPIIGGYGGRVPTSQSGRAGHQAPTHHIAEGLSAQRQTVLPRRRRVVDGVLSQYACGLLVRQSVQAIGRRGVLGQVWGSTRVSGSRDTTSDDSSARGLGKAAQLQVGRNRHDGQHPKREQSNFVRLQTLCSRGAVLVRPSIVLEEKVVVANQRPRTTQTQATHLLETLVRQEPGAADSRQLENQRPGASAVERVQEQQILFPLWGAAPCRHRLPSRHQGREEISQ